MLLNLKSNHRCPLKMRLKLSRDGCHDSLLPTMRSLLIILRITLNLLHRNISVSHLMQISWQKPEYKMRKFYLDYQHQWTLRVTPLKERVLLGIQFIMTNSKIRYGRYSISCNHSLTSHNLQWSLFL